MRLLFFTIENLPDEKYLARSELLSDPSWTLGYSKIDPVNAPHLRWTITSLSLSCSNISILQDNRQTSRTSQGSDQVLQSTTAVIQPFSHSFTLTVFNVIKFKNKNIYWLRKGRGCSEITCFWWFVVNVTELPVTLHIIGQKGRLCVTVTPCEC